MEPIHRAAWRVYVAAIDQLVAEDEERPNAQIQVDFRIGGTNFRACTPLMLAAHRGKDAVVGRLLALGADAGLQSVFGWFTTHWACFGKQSSSLKLLLDAGASMDARSNLGRTPLMAAAEYGADDCMTLLLERSGAQLGTSSGWWTKMEARRHTLLASTTNLRRWLCWSTPVL